MVGELALLRLAHEGRDMRGRLLGLGGLAAVEGRKAFVRRGTPLLLPGGTFGVSGVLVVVVSHLHSSRVIVVRAT